ncbi:polymorphic toxin-type HINT domain-containing protein [Salinithrix halophila]|uniref:Polymorphic toxin-type HINT domain-containing protein n=1 Tax=Salinithrix halophila TaxID=1485204 RepID=A0ABV8J9S8_9BACL
MFFGRPFSFLWPWSPRVGSYWLKLLKALLGMCFVAGTKVITDDGEKPIEEIKVGDKVLSKDEKTGKKSYKKVTRLYRRHVNTLYEVHAGGEKIQTTAEHPFWVQGKGWVKAKDLQKGDRLQAADGRQVRVDRVVQRKTKPIKVYNFEVEDYHTYFVSDAQVWVHNKCDIKFASKPTEHMDNPGRYVPVQILKEATKSTKGYPDPRGASNALMHYTPMYRNRKKYNLEVLFDHKENEVLHFKYDRRPLGPLPAIKQR